MQDIRIFDHIDDAKRYFPEHVEDLVQCKSCGLWSITWETCDVAGYINPHTGVCDLCSEGYYNG